MSQTELLVLNYTDFYRKRESVHWHNLYLGFCQGHRS